MDRIAELIKQQGRGNTQGLALRTATTTMRAEDIFDLVKNLSTIVEEVAKVVYKTTTGNGMSPQARRVMILKKPSHSTRLFAFFLAVHTQRGASWRLYASQRNDIQSEYRTTAEYFGISISASDKGVTSQVIAVAFSDLLIYYRMGHKLRVGNETYPGDLPDKYQWIGSLAAMYVKGEDESNQERCWLEKTVQYIQFLNWYVATTGRITGRPRKSNDDAAVARRVLGGAHFAWGAWTMETRKSWFEGKFEIVPMSPDRARVNYPQLTGDIISEIIDQYKLGMPRVN